MRWQGTEEETCFSLQGFLRWLLSPSKVVSFHGLSRKLDGGMKDQLAPGGDGAEELSSAGEDCPPAPLAQICPLGWCGGLTSLLPKPAAPFSPFLGSLCPHLSPSIGLLDASSPALLGTCCLCPCTKSQRREELCPPSPSLGSPFSHLH